MSNSEENIKNIYKNTRDFMLTYISLPLITFGIIGNVLSIIILLRPRMRSMQVFVYLITLVSTDLFVLLFRAVPWILFGFTQIDLRSKHIILCKFISYTSDTSLLYASWLTVLITMERMVCVCYPIWSNIHLNIRSRVFVLLITFFATSGVTFIHFIWKELIYVTPNQVRCGNATDEENVKIYSMIYTFLFCFIPAILLFSSSCVIIFKLRNRFLVKDSQQKKANKSQASNDAARILIFINVIFFVNVLPYGILTFIVSYVDLTNFSATLLGITDTLFYVANSINFLLYTASGPTFRKELRDLFCCKKPQPLSTKLSLSRSVYSVNENMSKCRRQNNNNNNSVRITSQNSVTEFHQISDTKNNP